MFGALAAAASLMPSCSSGSSANKAHAETSTTATGRGGGAKPVYAPPWGFGGYDDSPRAPVTSIGATWKVPAISARSGAGLASTWIGADNGLGDFIQLGVVETARVTGGRLRAGYTAFWSDTDRHDLAQTLMGVRAGDEMVFSMVESRRGWRLTARDLTTDTTRSVSTTYGAGDLFTRGQWLQEDPIGHPNALRDKPYPVMQLPTFRHMLLDGVRPMLSYDESQALVSPNGIVLVPTKVRDASFSFTHGSPSQARYLRATLPLDYSLNGLNRALATFRRLDRAARARALTSAMAGIAATQRALRRPPWPAGARQLIGHLVAHDELVIRVLRRWRSAGSGADPRLEARYESLVAEDRYYADPIRAALGLPPAS
jgi:hypothetical protein